MDREIKMSALESYTSGASGTNLHNLSQNMNRKEFVGHLTNCLFFLFLAKLIGIN